MGSMDWPDVFIRFMPAQLRFAFFLYRVDRTSGAEAEKSPGRIWHPGLGV